MSGCSEPAFSSDRVALRRRDLIVATVAFALLAVLCTYPQATHLSTHVGPHYDALFSVWRMAWVAHQLVTDPARLFDANIFYPQRNTLAYSDAVLLPALAGAPLLWAGVPPLVAYNLLILLSFVCAGIGMFVLAHHLTGSRLAAALAGVVFAFQPYRFSHYSHLELLWTCWIPLSLWALHRLVRAPTWTNGGLLGLLGACQVLTSIYYGVFLATALAVVGVPLLVACRSWHRWRLGMPVLGLIPPVLVLLGPYSLPYRESAAALGERDAAEVSRWSPTLANYVEAQAGHWLYPRRGDIDPFEGVLFPGLTVVALAVYGVWRERRGSARWIVAAYVLLLIVAVDLSLGSHGLLFGLAREVAWPYRGLRVPARMFVVVSVALAVLAAFGVRALTRFARGRVLAVSAILIALVEGVSLPIDLMATPLPPRRTLEFMATRPGPVFHWPVPETNNLGHTHDLRYMYFSVYHWQPLLNGYSGHHPESYLRLLERTTSFPARTSIQALQRAGVRHIVLHGAPDPAAFAGAVSVLRLDEALEYQFSERTADEEVALFVLRPPR